MKKQLEQFVEVENRLKDEIAKICNERDTLKEKVDKIKKQIKENRQKYSKSETEFGNDNEIEGSGSEEIKAEEVKSA